MTILGVLYGVARAIAILMYRTFTLNIFHIATVRWTPITIIIVPYQTHRTPNILIDK